MILLSSIVKSGSFYVYSNKEESGRGRVQEGRKQYTELDKNHETLLEQALRKSRHIYEEASKRANDIVENARVESDCARIEAEQQGYRDGYTRGIMEGAEEARKSSEEGLKEIEDLTNLLNQERRESIERRNNDIINIAFEIAKKIMRQHIQADENAIIGMLDDVLHENEAGLKIYLSEYSKTLNVTMDKDIAKKMRKISKNIKVVVTEHEDLIMVETENGMVDMSVPVQLKQLREALNLEK